MNVNSVTLVTECIPYLIDTVQTLCLLAPQWPHPTKHLPA